MEGGYKEIVSNMLEKGADLSLKDADENTALHIATKLGYYDIATVLLKNGANFESANKVLLLFSIQNLSKMLPYIFYLNSCMLCFCRPISERRIRSTHCYNS